MRTVDETAQVTRFYSIRQASKLSGIGYNTLLGAVKHGLIRSAQIGSVRRVSVSALNDFAEDLETGGIVLKTAS